MSYDVELMDGSLVIAGEHFDEAMGAVEVGLGAPVGSWRELLTELGFALDEQQVRGGVVITGYRGAFDDPVDQVLAALAPYVGDRILVWENDEGIRWRYVFADGRITEQEPVVLWRGVHDRTCRLGGVLAPMTVTRDGAAYAAWWAGLPDRAGLEEIVGDALPGAESVDLAETLHGLILDVFQRPDTNAAAWLTVQGLRPGVRAETVVLDIEPAYDCSGVHDGVNVVLSVHTAGETQRAYRSVTVYLDKARDLLPEVLDDAATVIGQIIDTAAVLLTAQIADEDRFWAAARDVLS